MVEDNVGNQFKPNAVYVDPKIANQYRIRNVVTARAEDNVNVKPGKRDVAYLQKQMQIAQKEEAGIQLTQEKFDFMTDTGACKEIKRVNVNCTLKDNLQQASTYGTRIDKAPVYDSNRSTEPVACDVCEGLLRGGFCLSCDLKDENSFTYDPNAYFFNDTSNNFNHLPQPQYENYLCNLCGNNSHDGYDCQQQFPLVYEQEPSYNQNYNGKYYPHDLSSFPCCDNCGGSHATFQCQPLDQNIDFSGSDQIQTPQYPDIHPSSQKINEEVFQAKEDLMKSIQTFLEEFNCIPFREKPKILLQPWDKFFAIQHAQPEDLNELFQKLLEDLQIINKELTECNHPTFFDDNEDHYVQYMEYLENSSKEIDASNSNQEKKKPPQDFEIRQLITEECFIEVYKEKQEVKNVVEQPVEHRTLHAIAPILSTEEPEYSLSMGYKHLNTTPETKLDEIIKSGVEELVPIPRECEVTSEDKMECDVLVYEDSSTCDVCDDHFEILSNSNDDISSDDDAFEDIKYVEALLPDLEIVSLEEENDVYQEIEEVDLEDIFQIQDVILREKLLSINRLIANIKSLNDNPTPDRVLKSSASFPIFEEFDNSLSDNFSPEFETFSDHTEETRSGNTTTHAYKSLPEYDSFFFEIKPDKERLTSIVKNDISDDLTNDLLLEEVDLFLALDNLIPSGIENFDYDSEGDIRFLEELLIDDSIPFPNNESFDFEDDLLFPRPPPEPPDVESFFDSKPDVIAEEISDELNKDNCFDPGGEIDILANDEDDNYFPFIFVIQIFLPYLIYPEVFPLLLFAESKDTIFDPEIPSGEIKVHIEVLSVLWGNRLPIRTVRCRFLAIHPAPNSTLSFPTSLTLLTCPCLQISAGKMEDFHWIERIRADQEETHLIRRFALIPLVRKHKGCTWNARVAIHNWRDIPKNTPLDRVKVLDMVEKKSKVRMGIMPTEAELALEQSQQGVSYEVSVMATPTIIVSAKQNLRDPIDIKVDIIHPEPVAAVGFPAAEELTDLRFRVDIAEAENASLRARIKNTEAIEKITRSQERMARMEIER
nr:hypothetical protein [Tanacetum cinerariifolium]